MILDGLLRFTDYPAGDKPTASGTSTYMIDLGMGSPGGAAVTGPPATPAWPAWVGIPDSSKGGGARDIGIGDNPALKILVQVIAAFNNLTSLTVALQGAIDNGSGAAAAFTTWWTSPAYALATLGVGARLMDMDVPRPPAGVAEPRFLQLAYTIAGSAPTTGAIAGFIVIDRYDQFYNATNNAITGGYVPGVVVAN